MSSSNRPLAELGQNVKGVIALVTADDPEMRKYLAALGLMADVEVLVEEIGPFNGPLLVRVGGARYALGREMAANIMVKGSA